MASNTNMDSEEGAVIKAKFFEQLLTDLKPKQNKIETRAIFRFQLDSVMVILADKNPKDPKYYYYKERYYVSTAEPPQLIEIQKDDDGAPNFSGVEKVVVCLEDMFDVCMSVHRTCSNQGRNSMIPEAKKFYANITRKIIEIFLNYSKEYQIKKKRTINHGLVVEPILSEYYNSRMQVFGDFVARASVSTWPC